MTKAMGVYLAAILYLLSVSVSADYMEGFVDMEDYASLAADWQNPADIDDFALLAANWLTSYAPAPMAWWEMEETSGAAAYDSTANAYDLVPADDFVIADATTIGKIGNGFLFDGSGERLTEPTLLDDFPDAITIIGWIRPDATGMSDTQTWFSKINADALGYAINLTCKMSSSTPNVIAASGRSYNPATEPTPYVGEYFNCNSSVTWVDDTWYHVAFTWDAGGCEIYVDGQFEGSDDMPIMGDVITGRNPVDLTIGNGGDTVQPLTEPFKGTIDDVKIYDRALSASEIQALLGFIQHPLVVNNGTGDGDYAENTVVAIAADTPPAGQVFDIWTGDTAYIADINNSTTTVTMPAAAVTVTATYRAIPLYALTVNSGTGGGSYPETTVVPIAADAPPAGQEFDVWTGDTAYIASVNNQTTTVTMPAQNVSVTATYKAVPSVMPSLAWWELEETSGSLAYDSSDQGNDLVATGGFSISSATTNGVNGSKGMMFDGSGERLTHPTLLDTLPSEGLTISGWARPDATGMSDSMCWFSKQNGTADYDEGGGQLWMRFDMSSGSPSNIKTTYRMPNWSTISLSGPTWVDDTWYHYALTWDPVNIVTRLYVDGELKNSSTAGFIGYLVGSGQDLTIATGGATSSPFKGVIDDVRLFSSVLTDSEIMDLYEFDTEPDAYLLSVNSGTGDGNYYKNTVVPITADAAPAGKEFFAWGGATANIDDPSSPTTTITMPGEDTTIGAAYRDLPTPHTLTVNNGDGDGSYLLNTVVNITADTPPAGQMFDVWTGDTVTVADIHDSTTTLTMPTNATTVSATYRIIPTVNSAPVVDAGDDLMLDPPSDQIAYLKGQVTDDGLPGAPLTYTWTKISGPGSVVFSDDTAVNTEATITVEGNYVLRLSVDDGALVTTDDIAINVHDNGRLIYPIIHTDIPKAMADTSNYTDIYVIDLSAFGIFNDGTFPVLTSAGINAALQHAKTLGANRIVFPAGTYLISEFEPILFNHQDTVVDLNGATLKLNPCSLSASNVVIVERGTRNFRLTNGTLMGDRFGHIYPALPLKHVSGRSLRIESGYNMEFDHLTIRDCVGFACTSHTDMEHTNATGEYDYLETSNLEQGAFTASGVKTADSTKIRTKNAMSLAKYLPDMEFEFGYSTGGGGTFRITSRPYQACFYNSSMTFIEKKDCVQFKKVAIPTGAEYIHFEFNQSNIPTETPVGRLTDFEPPEHVHFHDNWLYRNRGLGMAYVGGQRWILENNLFEENGIVISGDDGQVALPAHGIDFEDGVENMQDVVFRNNEFKNNGGDLVVAAGTEMIFENNHMESNMTFWPRTDNIIARNNAVDGFMNQSGRGSVQYATRTGNLSVHDNVYRDFSMVVDNNYENVDPIMFENEVFDDCSLIRKGTYSEGHELVYDNCIFTATRWLVPAEWTDIMFTDCEWTDTTLGLHFYVDGPDVTITETNCIGSPSKYGTYVDRWVP